MNDGHKRTRVAWLQVLSCMSDSDGLTQGYAEEAFPKFSRATRGHAPTFSFATEKYPARRPGVKRATARSGGTWSNWALGTMYSLVLALQRGRESASCDDASRRLKPILDHCDGFDSSKT